MKTSPNLRRVICLTFSVFLGQVAHADAPYPPGNTNSPPPPLASWSFQDTNHWTSDQHYAPISFTNISWSNLGDGHSLVVNTSDAPAFLNYYIFEPTNGATNLVLKPSGGSLTLWYAPNWSSGTNGGTGPGQLAQLINVGELGSSAGYWGLSVPSSGSNIVFESQDGSGNTYSLSAPISWTTNFFHFIALTYGTNVSLYLDGQLATNHPGGLSIWPPSGDQSVWFGSDTNGNEQAQGLFNTIQTYNTVLNSTNIQQIYNGQGFIYAMNPYDIPYLIASANSEPSYGPTYQAITGQGNLTWLSDVDNCVNASEYDVWLTNIVTTMAANGTMNVSFTILGGESGVAYDVFANSVLHGGTNGIPWGWMGQGYPCSRYMLTNLPPTDCFVILGTPYTSNPGSGLTDAYELLVLQVSPSGPQSDSYGVPYAWYAQHGLGPITNGLATADPDQDAIVNYQEYLYGTNPRVSEGFGIWVSTPNGTSSIP